jgi:hypothetical protein
MTELRPNPIRSDTSRHGTAAAPAGDSDANGAAPAEAGRDATVDPISRALSSRVSARMSGPCGRCKSPLSRGPQAGYVAARPACAGLTGMPGTERVSPLAQSRRDPWPRAASPDAPRREPGSADTRGAFHRRAAPPGDARAFVRDTGLAPCLVRGTGRFPQVVANLWRIHGASCNLRPDRAALTSRPAAKDRSPWWMGSGGACKAAWVRAEARPIDARGMRREPHPRAPDRPALPGLRGAQTHGAPVDFCDRNDPRPGPDGVHRALPHEDSNPRRHHPCQSWTKTSRDVLSAPRKAAESSAS